MKPSLVSRICLAFASLTVVPSLAYAQAPDPETPPPTIDEGATKFGQRGQFVFTATGGSSFASVSHVTSFDGAWSVSFTPSFSYFVANNVSLGLKLDVGYESGFVTEFGEDAWGKTTSFGAGAVGGVNVPLTRSASFWPQLTLGLHHTHATYDTLLSDTTSVTGIGGVPYSSDDATSGLWVDAYAPVLLHLAPHFFMGFGPRIYHDFAGSPAGLDGERTTAGGYLTVGGWWGGPAGASDAERSHAEGVPDGEQPRTKRFGDAKQIVLTSDFDLGASLTGYSRASVTAHSLAIGPNVDWFFTEHVFVGVGARYARDDAGALSDTSTVGASARLGVDMPISPLFSWAPRAALAYAITSTGSSFASDSHAHATSFSAGAPILAHVAPHFFLGFGPDVSHVLSQSSGGDSGTTTSGATRVGASALLGGWL